MVHGEEVFFALAGSGLRGLYCSITKETCFVCPRNYLVTYWLAQLENVSYLAFAIIREHELLVEILSLRSLDEFSPKSAADLYLFVCLRALLDFLLYSTHVCIGGKWIAFCSCWRLRHATQCKKISLSRQLTVLNTLILETKLYTQMVALAFDD